MEEAVMWRNVVRSFAIFQYSDTFSGMGCYTACDG